MKTIITAFTLLGLTSCSDNKIEIKKQRYVIEQDPVDFYSFEHHYSIATYIHDTEDSQNIVYSSYKDYTLKTFDSVQASEYRKAKVLISKFEKMQDNVDNPKPDTLVVDIKAMPLESDTVTY